MSRDPAAPRVARFHQAAAAALLIWTLTVTLARTVRLPNDFAEAHWLLDYRFGPVKRGFVGTLLSSVTNVLGVPITRTLVATLAVAAFSVFCGAMLAVSLRILRRSNWSPAAVLASLAFLSSPFIVMSAHVVGYYDNFVFVLGAASIALILRGRVWAGAALQGVTMLVHESALLVVYPAFCLALMLGDTPRSTSRAHWRLWMAAGVPVLVFAVVAIGQAALLAGDFAPRFRVRLEQSGLVAEHLETLPGWIARSAVAFYDEQSPKLLGRLAASPFHGLVLPTTLAILTVVSGLFRVRGVSWTAAAVLAVCFGPQVIHAVAWDTERIWTYTIAGAFLALWIVAETRAADPGAGDAILPCVVAIAANVLVATPLLDYRDDRFAIGTRLLLFLPVLVGIVLLYAPDLRRLPRRTTSQTISTSAATAAAKDPPNNQSVR